MIQSPSQSMPLMPRDAQEVQDWLRVCVAGHVQRPVQEICADLPLSEYGLDSVYVFALCSEIEDRYGIEVEPTLLWDHQAIDTLAEALWPLIVARHEGSAEAGR